jgi:hypothetical protein
MFEEKVGSNNSYIDKTTLLDEEGRLILKPKGILKFRTKVLHSRSINEYLIKWKNLLEEKST